MVTSVTSRQRPAQQPRSRRSGSKRTSPRAFVHKPAGRVDDRVQRVGPQHFGIVCVDCAKARSKWMLCDFFGKVLLPPAELPHTQGHFSVAVMQLQEAIARHALQDQIVAVERTGNYHQPVKRAFAAAGFETRIIHPFATKRFRQVADPGNKTDDTDLLAIFRAAVNGCGLREAPRDEVSQTLQLLARHRRDLVEKRSAVCCQIREHLEMALPGYAAQFEDLWDSRVAMPLVRHFASPEAVRAAQLEGLQRKLRELKLSTPERILQQLVIWSSMAATPDAAAAVHHRIAVQLDDDRLRKTAEIQALERELAHWLVRTPYVLLLSHPGINVITASELAGEMGPITHYASAKAITGRAGLFPSRYQSDEVDRPNGRLVRSANRSLRAVLLLIADNLLKCNAYFKARAIVWKKRGKTTGQVHIQVACRFSRSAFQIVAGRKTFCHPGQRQRDYILDKLLAYHRAHHTPLNEVLPDLKTAIAHIPNAEHSAEAVPLKQLLLQTNAMKRRGAQPLAGILPVVLALLGADTLQSMKSEVQDPSELARPETDNVFITP